jgi:hypothetical protein
MEIKGYTRRNMPTRPLFDKRLLLFCAFASLHNRFLSQSRGFHEFVPGPLEMLGANRRQLGLLDACRVNLLRYSKQTPSRSPDGWAVSTDLLLRKVIATMLARGCAFYAG